MPKHQNVTSEQLNAFIGAGHTITYCEPAFVAPSQQSTFATMRDIRKQRGRARREQRAMRERERLSELYGASDPFALAASYQLGN